MEYFQLAPNMRTAYVELCVYLISKSAFYTLGRLSKIHPPSLHSQDLPDLARNTIYIGSSVYGRKTIEGKYMKANGIWAKVGLRANIIYKYDVKKQKAYSSTYEKEMEGKEVCSKEVYCATTRSTPGGSAD